MLKKPLSFVQELLKTHVVQGDTVIDATVGNGNDTVLLASLVGSSGKVYGFDVQEAAIQTTKEKLILTGLFPQTELILDGHENLDLYVNKDSKISAITFNLGYLPKSDKSIITTPKTTLSAINIGLTRLRTTSQTICSMPSAEHISTARISCRQKDLLRCAAYGTSILL